MRAESMVEMMILLEGNHCFQDVEDLVLDIHRINKSAVHLDLPKDSTFICNFYIRETLFFESWRSSLKILYTVI